MAKIIKKNEKPRGKGPSTWKGECRKRHLFKPLCRLLCYSINGSIINL